MLRTELTDTLVSEPQGNTEAGNDEQSRSTACDEVTHFGVGSNWSCEGLSLEVAI